MQADTKISKIANFARITNSSEVANINEDTTPKPLETIFRPKKYVAKHINVPYNATGNLAENSHICPNKAKDKHSPQK